MKDLTLTMLSTLGVSYYFQLLLERPCVPYLRVGDEGD
jgi:hypothetical protein